MNQNPGSRSKSFSLSPFPSHSFFLLFHFSPPPLFSFSFFLSCLFSLAGSHKVVLAGLELIRLPLNIEQSVCLCLPNTEITGMAITCNLPFSYCLFFSKKTFNLKKKNWCSFNMSLLLFLSHSSKLLPPYDTTTLFLDIHRWDSHYTSNKRREDIRHPKEGSPVPSLWFPESHLVISADSLGSKVGK